MKRDKYMGMDLHQATTVVAMMNVEGKVVVETMVPTKSGPIRDWSTDTSLMVASFDCIS